jgi:hypothetical protein
MHRFADAEAALKEAVSIQRELAAQNSAAYQRDLATTLGNLGLLYTGMQRFDDGEVALIEVAGIERELAAQDPAVYRPVLAGTLNNLGALCTPVTLPGPHLAFCGTWLHRGARRPEHASSSQGRPKGPRG